MYNYYPSIEIVKLGKLSFLTNDVKQSYNNPIAQLKSLEEPLHLDSKDNYPSITSQLDYLPISQDQLALEVKAIYVGLVIVEARSINVDSQKAAHPKELLSTKQQQALITLYRTLLYKHYDFLIATQYLLANNTLLGLVQKYSILVRIQKHSIDAFLEVLYY